jgi:hypothetical protein
MNEHESMEPDGRDDFRVRRVPWWLDVVLKVAAFFVGVSLAVGVAIASEVARHQLAGWMLS